MREDLFSEKSSFFPIIIIIQVSKIILLILIMYALCYFSLLQSRPIFLLLMHAKFSDVVHISHQKYIYIYV